MNQPLAIVGASTRSAAASAVRAGFQPLAADLFADADLRRIATATRISPYPEGLVDWLRAMEPPVWMYTGALENYPELVDQMAWIAPLWGNPGDVLARVRSPWELASALQDAGLLFPETRATAEGLPNDGSWLVKTYRGASGSGVREWNCDFGSENDQSTVCYQQRIGGTPCAAVYVAADGSAQLLGVTRQLIGESWLGAHGFQYCGSIGPWPTSESGKETLVRLGNILAADFELVGLFGVDFMYNDGNVWTLEVNPRYTASVEIIERLSGVSAIQLHSAACGGVGDFATSARRLPPKLTNACGKAILFATSDGRVSQQFAEWTLAEALREPWPALGDVPPANTLIETGRPILTVFAEGATVESVEQQLRRDVAAIFAKLDCDSIG